MPRVETMFDALEILGERWPRNGKVPCPNHADVIPSLQLYQDSFYCFSCGATGDHFGFLALVTGKPLREVFSLWGDNAPHTKVRSSIKEVIGPTARRRQERAAWKGMHDRLFARVWEVWAGEKTDVLLEEIVRLSEALVDLREDVGDMPGRDYHRFLKEFEEDWMWGLDVDEARLVGDKVRLSALQKGHT